MAATQTHRSSIGSLSQGKTIGHPTKVGCCQGVVWLLSPYGCCVFLAVVGSETGGKAELFLLAVQVIHQGGHCEVGLMEARVSHPKVATYL